MQLCAVEEGSEALLYVVWLRCMRKGNPSCPAVGVGIEWYRYVNMKSLAMGSTENLWSSTRGKWPRNLKPEKLQLISALDVGLEWNEHHKASFPLSPPFESPSPTRGTSSQSKHRHCQSSQ